jgi:hypothetical protein
MRSNEDHLLHTLSDLRERLNPIRLTQETQTLDSGMEEIAELREESEKAQVHS